MTEWNELLDQALQHYANPEQPGGLEARVLARAEQKRHRRNLLIFAPLATACAAAIVVAVMLSHEPTPRSRANATAMVTNVESSGGTAFTARTKPKKAQQAAPFRPTLPARSHEAGAIAKSLPPVFPAPSSLTAEERRMQALAQDGAAIVPAEEPELVISQLDIQPLKIQQEDQGANNEQTQP